MQQFHKYLTFLLLTLSITSCDKDKLAELNIDATSANELDWRFLFTSGQVQAAENRLVNRFAHLSLAGGLTQHLSTLSTNNVEGSGDKYLRCTDGCLGTYLSRVYGNSLKTLAEVIRQTGPEGLNPTWTNLHHMARVMYLIPMHIMTDLYGNVPYSEANQGIEGLPFPVYDDQESIYRDMLNTLEVAASVIGSGPDQVGEADLIYRGNLLQWKKLANSLMLRLAMRISNVDPTTAEKYVQSAINGGLMTSNEDLAWVAMKTGPNIWFNQNGISRALLPTDGKAPHMMSRTLVDFLQSHGDPRLRIYAVRGVWGGPYLTETDQQIGLPNGYDNETIKDFLGTEDEVNRELAFSRLNPLLIEVDAPFLFMTYAEVEFLLAEAALKGWHNGLAAEHYNTGVKASMQQWTLFNDSLTVTESEVGTYLAAHPFDGSERMIGEQMWISNFMNWYEVYSNWRRTGYPELTPVDYPGNISGGQIFRRFEYGSREVAVNPNVVSGGTQPNDVKTRVWWDVN